MAGISGELMRWDVINELLSRTRQKRFLEIGVQFGNCGARIRSATKWGVDPAPMRSAESRYGQFFRKTSDEFFSTLDDAHRFDVILVDGLHHAEQVARDVENSLRFLSEDGAIVMHDCSPASEAAQRVPRETGIWNGDCWRAMVALRQRPELDAFTIDADHGVGVVRKRAPISPLETPPGPLTYADLERDRRRLLGLVGQHEWTERLDGRPGLGRVVVVSAIFGKRDRPLEVPALDADECVMFTDGRGARGWRVEHVEPATDPRTAARRIKTLALELVEGDVVVWIDGRIKITGPMRATLSRGLSGTEIAGYPHPWRSCAYDEARECAALGLAPAAALEEQAGAYRSAGFPAGAGLWNTMVLARRRTPEMIALGRAWWNEIQRHTVRDQVSFPFLLWRAGIRCGRLGNDVYRADSSSCFRRGHHAA